MSNGSLSRRMMMKALAAAPLAAQQAAMDEVGAKVLAPSYGIPQQASGYASRRLELVALAKAGLLPEWVKRLGRRRIAEDRRIDPEVAALKSVSLVAKLHISTDRRYQRDHENMEQDVLDDQLQAQFFGYPT